MAEYVRPSYLEELSLPPQRLPDYAPAAPAAVAVEPPAVGTPTVPEQPAVAASVGPDEAPARVAFVEAAAAPGQTIKLSGWISSAVHVVERRGSTAVSFSLVETEAAGTPQTHRVYATKQFAERLAKQQLRQGMSVEVAGQPQPRDEQQPDGSTKSVAYLYCFGVRVLAATPA